MPSSSTRHSTLPSTPKLHSLRARTLPVSQHSRSGLRSSISPSKSMPSTPSPQEHAFIQLKGQLKLADTLVSFDAESGRLKTVAYPMWRDGQAVLPEDLFEYLKTHDWPLPFCFCAITTGSNVRTKLMQPHFKKSEHQGDPCLTCPTYSCKYFLNIAHLVARVGTIAPLQFYTLIHGHSAAFEDESDDGANAQPEDGPVFPFTQAPRTRSATSSPLVASKGKRKRLGDIFDEDNAYADDIDRFWSPPVDGLEFLRAHAREILSDDEALKLLLKMADPENPGITWADFIKIFSKCYGCSLIMTSRNLKRHKCAKSLLSASCSELKAGPSVGKREVIDLTDD